MKIIVSLLVVLFVVAVNGQTGPCANVRTRAAWGARAANPAWLSTQPPTHFVVHHTVTATCTTTAACDATMRSMQNGHMTGNGWADIGYNFCIGNTNIVYEGRGWNRSGAHSPSFNTRSIGFCFIGNFMTVLPPQNVLNTAQAFIICARDWGRLTTTYRLMGHRQDVATACPGDALFNQIRTWPRWS
ncbi:CLUMA_CG011105, isoform A [Clunio marinus]|uniref:Peptidoglycan-recognition protein n=1 Tax=Clunio marinus TaxID=568069 RepID=A0A1J1IBS0_9DIPT|nr:CLUMA_CG011105, isoform A [Clunio marinus]